MREKEREDDEDDAGAEPAHEPTHATLESGSPFLLDSKEILASNGLIAGELQQVFADMFSGKGLEPIPTPAEFRRRREEAEAARAAAEQARAQAEQAKAEAEDAIDEISGAQREGVEIAQPQGYVPRGSYVNVRA